MNVIGKYGFGISEIWESENLKISGKSCVHNLKMCLYEPSSFFVFQNMIIWWNHEKSKTRNLLTLISPAEFLQKLGYEFSFDQKTWIDFVVKRTNFSIFGRGNPYHQSTYRFPPLHPISAPVGMGTVSCGLRTQCSTISLGVVQSAWLRLLCMRSP